MPGSGLFDTALNHGVLGVSCLVLMLAMGLTYKVVGILTNLIQGQTAATQAAVDAMNAIRGQLDRIEGRLH